VGRDLPAPGGQAVVQLPEHAVEQVPQRGVGCAAAPAQGGPRTQDRPSLDPAKITKSLNKA